MCICACMWTHIYVRPHITFPHKVILRLVACIPDHTANSFVPICMCVSVSGWLADIHLWHDDVRRWRHFPRYWPFVRGVHWSPVNSRHEGRWCGALMFSLVCAWVGGWVDNERLVAWGAITPIMASLQWFHTSTGMPNHWEGINPIWPSDATYQQIWVTSDSANDLLPDDTKPLPGSVGTYQ